MTQPANPVTEVAADLAAAREAAAPVQLDLMPPGMDRLQPYEAQRAERSVTASRAGRPPGAQNKATADAKRFVRQVIGFDPLIEGARWAMHTPESLSLVLGCTIAEAFDRLMHLHEQLRRYLHAPMAAVDDTGAAVAPTFNMIFGAGGPRALPPGQAPWAYLDLEKTEENQGSGGQPLAVSHAAVSHEADK